MQLITVASAAAALVAGAAAADVAAFNLNSTTDVTKPKARIFNRCSYDVYLWSVVKGLGCPDDQAVVLKSGDFYQENFRPAYGDIGTSIKISKTNSCKSDNVQLEYFLETTKPMYSANYLDVSYVDCLGNDCPTKSEGFYLKSGNENGQFMANEVNEICPILSCASAEECATMAYILPDDRQTKSCDLEANLDFYMCGSEAPGEQVFEPITEPIEDLLNVDINLEQKQDEPAAVAAADVEPTPAAAAVPEVTAAPAVDPAVQEQRVKTQVEVVYVTAYEYVNAKRHAHAHANAHRRRQFRA